MPKPARTPLPPLADPLLWASASGETLDANPAFDALAASCATPAELPRLFGAAVFPLIAQARRDGQAQAFLPLVVGPEPHRTFRLSLDRSKSDGAFAVLLVNVSDEIAWRKQLAERNRELTVLNDIGAALSATLELDELAERIHQQTSRIMGASSFYIALHDPESHMLSFPIYVDDGAKREVGPRPFGSGMSEHLLRTAKPLLLSWDVVERARALGIEPVGRPCHSWLGVPILAEGAAIGVIALQDYDHAKAYDTHDLEVLTIIAGQAAAAIQNARLFAATRSAYRELSEAQARLLESERLRGITETVGALNHEVNNPLAAIAGNAQLLLRTEAALRPEARAKVEAVLQAARRIQHVTSRMTSLIQATSRPYPGDSAILDIRRSIAREEPAASVPAHVPPTEEPTAEAA